MVKVKAINGKALKTRVSNVSDVIVLGAAYAAFKTADILANDIVGGEFIKKAKARKLEKKAKKEADKLMEEQGYRELEVPAVIETNQDTDAVTVQFSVQEEPTTKVLNNNMLNDIIKKYNYSDKLLATAILWCCGKIEDAQVGAVISNADLEGTSYEKLIFINSITMFFIDKRFVNNPNYADIEFGILPSSLEIVIRDLSNLDILNGNETLSKIIEKTREYVKEKSNKTIVIFDNSKLDLNVSNCPKELLSKIEGAFGDILSGYKHYVNKLPGGLAEVIVVKSENKAIKYIVDPAVIHAGEYKWLITDVNGTDYFTSDKEMIKNFIDYENAVSTDKVLDMLIEEHQFIKQDLALNYDFTLIYNKMKEMDRDQLMLLEAKLNFIRAEIIDRFKVSPRMKVKNLKDIDSFIVTSDSKISSPLDEMAKEYIDGLTVKCKGETYVIELRDINGNLTGKDTVTMTDELAKTMLISNGNLEDIRAIQANAKVMDTVYNK